MRVVRAADEVEDDLSHELRKLRAHKYNVQILQGLVDEQTKLVTQMLEDRGQKSKTVDGYRYTLVQAERVKVNEQGLKKALGARAFNKLTVAKIDQSKLKEAMTDGTVDPIIVEQHSEVVLNKPSIRISEVQSDDE